MGDRLVKGRRFNRTPLCGVIAVAILGMSSVVQGAPGDDDLPSGIKFSSSLEQATFQLGHAGYRAGIVAARLGELKERLRDVSDHRQELETRINNGSDRNGQPTDSTLINELHELQLQRDKAHAEENRLRQELGQVEKQLGEIIESRSRWTEYIDGQYPGAVTVNLIGAHLGHIESENIARIRAEIFRHETELDRLKVASAEAQVKQTEHERKFRDVSDRRNALMSQVERLESQVADLEAQKEAGATIGEQNDSLRRKKQELVANVEAMMRVAELDQGCFNQYIQRILAEPDVRQVVSDLENALAQARREAEHFEQLARQNLCDMQDEQREVAELQDRLDQLEEVIAGQQALLDDAQAVINDLRQPVPTLEERLFPGVQAASVKKVFDELSSFVAAGIKASVNVTRESDAKVILRLTSPEKGNLSMASGIASGDHFSGFDGGGFWSSFIYRDGSLDRGKDDNFLKYRDKINGIILGVDGDLSDQFKAGFAFTYANTDAKPKDFNNGSQSVKGNHYIGTFYGGWTEGPWFANGLLSYAVGKNDYKYMGKEDMPLDCNGVVLKGSGDTSTWSFTLGGGYKMPVNEQWVFQPKTQFNYMNVGVDENKLKNGQYSLEFKAKSFQVAEVGVGFGMIGNIPVVRGVLNPEFKLMGFYDFKGQNYKYDFTPHCAGAGIVPSISVDGRKRDQSRCIAGVGMNYAANGSLSLGLGYDFNFSEHYTGHALNAMVSYSF